MRDGRERRGRRRAYGTPLIHRYGGRNVVPGDPEVWELRTRLAYRFTRGEIARVLRNRHVVIADPYLEQAGINIDQSRLPKAIHDRRRSVGVPVDEQLRLGYFFDFQRGAVQGDRPAVTGPARDSIGQAGR